MNRARKQPGRAADAARIAELTAEVETLKGKMNALFAYMAAVAEHSSLPTPPWAITPPRRPDGPLRLVTDSDVRHRSATSGGSR